MTAPVLTSKLDRESPEAKTRFDHNKALAAELRERVAEAALGGNEKHRERHVARGKMAPRAATRDGVLELRWDRVTGRGTQIAEVWLLKVSD